MATSAVKSYASLHHSASSANFIGIGGDIKEVKVHRCTGTEGSRGIAVLYRH